MATTNARVALLGERLALAQHEHTARALEYGRIEARHGDAHHRAAEDDLVGVVRQATAPREHVAKLGADGHDPVSRLSYARAGHRHDALDQRQPGLEDLGESRDRTHVLHDDADFARQPAGRNFTIQHRLDEHFFGALGIFRLERADLDIEVRWQRGSHRFQGVGLVLLDSDDGATNSEAVEHDANAQLDAFAVLDHHTVIRGEIGLALAAVDQ